LSGQLGLSSVTSRLVTLQKSDPSGIVRTAALRALRDLGYSSMEQAMYTALDDESAEVRRAGLEMLTGLAVAESVKADLLAGILETGTIFEQQQALQTLGSIEHPNALAKLEMYLDRLVEGSLSPELRLELGESIQASGDDQLMERLQAYRQAEAGQGVVGQYSDVLYGGEPSRGEQILYSDASQCMRCHNLETSDGQIAPSLNGIAGRLTRRQLLEALVDPGARIAPGYGQVSLRLAGEQQLRGLLEGETDSSLSLRTANGQTRVIAKDQIESRTDGPSSMPPIGQTLSRTDLRDLIEYLSTLN